jgi:hypothetical protein
MIFCYLKIFTVTNDQWVMQRANEQRKTLSYIGYSTACTVAGLRVPGFLLMRLLARTINKESPMHDTGAEVHGAIRDEIVTTNHSCFWTIL